jgi:hypothetical protein
MSVCRNCKSSFDPVLGWNSVVCPNCAANPQMTAAAPEEPRVRTRKQRFIRLAVFAAILLVVVGWYVLDGRRAEDRAVIASHQAVDRFHQLINAQSYERLWNDGSAFADPTKKQDVLRMFAFVHEKLGNAQATTRRTIDFERLGDAGPTTTAVYATRFENGEAEETFIFRQFASGEMKLVGYTITSPQFAIN